MFDTRQISSTRVEVDRKPRPYLHIPHSKEHRHSEIALGPDPMVWNSSNFIGTSSELQAISSRSAQGSAQKSAGSRHKHYERHFWVASLPPDCKKMQGYLKRV
jgi:hypothetical protein